MTDKTLTTDHAKLAAKLAAVIEGTGKVAKAGKNTFQNYSYATEADIVEEIRGALAKNKIFIVPSVVEHKYEQVNTKNGTGNLTTVTMDFEIIDSETGYSIKSRFYGQSMDTGDKGLYKAYTGAEKYFLLKTFLISTGDDVEKDSPEVAPASPQTQPVQSRVEPPMTQFQSDKILKLVSQKGKHEMDVSALALTAYKVGDWHKMNIPQASAVIEKLEKLPDLQSEESVDIDEVSKAIDEGK